MGMGGHLLVQWQEPPIRTDHEIRWAPEQESTFRRKGNYLVLFSIEPQILVCQVSNLFSVHTTLPGC